MRRDARDFNYINQIPVRAICKEVCRAGEYQAGGSIFVLGLYFNKAPVFRFFKTELNAAKIFPLRSELRVFCIFEQCTRIKPAMQISGNMRMRFSYISGWTGFLISYPTSLPLKQKSVNSYIKYGCEGSDIL